MHKATAPKYQISKRNCLSAISLAVGFAGLLLCAALLTPSPANAASTSVRVSARILPWLDVSATPLVSSYRVDNEDIRRGFVDLPNALSIRLATNLRSDIDLNLSSFGPERIVVGGNESFGSDLLRIPAPPGNEPVISNLDLRVILSDDMQEGDYPLQVNVSVVNI